MDAFFLDFPGRFLRLTYLVWEENWLCVCPWTALRVEQNSAHGDVSQFCFLSLAWNSLCFLYRSIHDAVIIFFFSCSLKCSVEQSSECKGLNRLWGKRYCKFLEKHLQIYKMLCVTMTLFPLPTYICCVTYYLANELLGGLELGCL